MKELRSRGRFCPVHSADTGGFSCLQREKRNKQQQKWLVSIGSGLW